MDFNTDVKSHTMDTRQHPYKYYLTDINLVDNNTKFITSNCVFKINKFTIEFIPTLLNSKTKSKFNLCKYKIKHGVCNNTICNFAHNISELAFCDEIPISNTQPIDSEALFKNLYIMASLMVYLDKHYDIQQNMLDIATGVSSITSTATTIYKNTYIQDTIIDGFYIVSDNKKYVMYKTKYYNLIIDISLLFLNIKTKNHINMNYFNTATNSDYYINDVTSRFIYCVETISMFIYNNIDKTPNLFIAMNKIKNAMIT
jgi:hypothetical protein